MERTVESMGEIKVGSVVRTFEGSFSNAVVLGFERESPEWPWSAVLARPYAYAHHCGTSQATPMVGVETFKVYVSVLIPAEKSRDGSAVRLLIDSANELG
jgi:hypothetical protein